MGRAHPSQAPSSPGGVLAGAHTAAAGSSQPQAHPAPALGHRPPELPCGSFSFQLCVGAACECGDCDPQFPEHLVLLHVFSIFQPSCRGRVLNRPERTPGRLGREYWALPWFCEDCFTDGVSPCFSQIAQVVPGCWENRRYPRFAQPGEWLCLSGNDSLCRPAPQTRVGARWLLCCPGPWAR